MFSFLIDRYQANKNRIHRLLTESAWVVTGQIMVVVASVVLVRVLTEYLDPNEYGQLALALTLGALIGQIAFSGVMPGIMRFYPIAAENGEAWEYLQASLRMMGYSVVVALVLSGLLLAGLRFFGKSDLIAVAVLAILLSVLGTINTAQSMIQNAARKRKVVAFHGSMDAWLKVLLAVSLINVFGRTAIIVIVAYIVSIISVLVSQTIFIRRLIPLRANKIAEPNLWQIKIWKYSKPFVYFNAFTWIQASADRWALDFFATTHDVGLYAVLLQVGYTPIGIVAGLVTTLVAPILFQRSGDGTNLSRNVLVYKRAWLITSVIAATTLLACIIAGVFHELIFKMLVAAEYRSVSYLLPYMVLGGGFFAMGEMLSIKLMSDLNTQALVWPKIVTSIIGAALSFIGAYCLGLVGVVIAVVAFTIINLAWMMWISLNPLLRNSAIVE